MKKITGNQRKQIKRGELIINLHPNNFRLELTSVWSFPNRGDWATHSGKYRGNWSPFVPRNLILRYSKPRDWILDQFVGSGTTLVEAKLLNRNAIGIDINPQSVSISETNLIFQCEFISKIYVKQGNAADLAFMKDSKIDFICTHPPYADIIRYSKDIKGDISLLSVDSFLDEMGKVAKEAYRVLKKGKYCAVMIRDIREHGKVIPQIRERMPEKYNKYYEPFVGGGAVIFELLPKDAVINDINRALINTYKVIRDMLAEFLAWLNKLDREMWEDGKKYYYMLREHYNDKLMQDEFDAELAALFVFLNKHCFNGLYRVNGKGLFNVPYNNSRRESCDMETIMAVSEYLKEVTIMEGDFQNACEDADKGDFVFIDSPYAPLNPTSFEAYTKEGFDVESHRRLAALFDELTARGCYCMLTNHNTDLINELYGNKGYRMDIVSVKRMINSDAANRVGEEVIICNY